MQRGTPGRRLRHEPEDARPAPARARHAGLDALRGFASLMVVALHAAVPYVLWPMPGLLWATRDPHPSPVVDVICWATQCCVMPTFFLLSGYFAAGLLSKNGPGPFFVGRLQRLLVPLGLAMCTVLPATLYIWTAGWVAAGRYAPLKLLSFRFEPEVRANLWGLAHLWFLEYLFVYCAALAAIAWLRQKVVPTEPATLTLRPPSLTYRWLTPALLFIMGATALWLDPAIVVGFQNSLLPVPSKLLYFATYFVCGLWLHRLKQPAQTSREAAWPAQFWPAGGIILAAATLAAVLPLVHLQQQAELTGITRLALAALLASYAWLMASSLFVAAQQWQLSPESRLGRATGLLADASFWMYLVHLPLVGLIQVDVADLPWSAAAKFAAVTLAAWGITLATYHVWVQGRWLGAILDGRRARRVMTSAASVPTENAARAA